MRIPAALSAVLLCLSVTNAQPGDPDPSYGVGGFAFTSAWQQTLPGVIKVHSDGGTVVAGFRYANAQNTGLVRLLRLDAQGAVDMTFGNNGVVTWEHQVDQTVLPRAITELPDGKLLVAAVAVVGFNEARPVILRFTEQGELDPDFGAQGVVWAPLGSENTTVLDMTVDSQGRILIGGELREGTGNISASEAYVMRLLANGTVDPSFGTAGVLIFTGSQARQETYHVVELADGRLLVLGASNDTGSSEALLLRLLPDGTPDADFGTAGQVAVPSIGGYQPLLFRLAVEADGTIRAGGNFQSAQGDERVGAMGFLADGALDTGYGNNGLSVIDLGPGTGTYDFPLAVLHDSDGALLVLAETDDGDGTIYAVARLLPNGQPDGGFGTEGVRSFPLPTNAWLTTSADLQADGKLVALGGLTPPGGNFPDLMVARLQPTATSIAESLPTIGNLSLFPNPVADRFTLTFQHEGDGPLRIELMDLQGRLVHRFAERVFMQGEQRLELAWPADAAQGAYHLVIIGRQGRATVHLLR